MQPPPPEYSSAVQYPTLGRGAPSSYLEIAMRPPPPSVAHPMAATAADRADPPRLRPKMGEIKAFDSSKERDLYEELSDLYSILKATEVLEKAYSRDAVGTSEYGEHCTRLISQFKTSESALRADLKIQSIEQFISDYGVDCPRARNRLVTYGVPATVMHASHDVRQEGVLVAETVQCFITAMDALKLEQRAIDEIQPLISDLMNAVTKIKSLPADFEVLRKLQHWLQELNKRRAVDNIEEDDARQLIFDLENSYAAFLQHLKSAT